MNLVRSSTGMVIWRAKACFASYSASSSTIDFLSVNMAHSGGVWVWYYIETRIEDNRMGLWAHIEPQICGLWRTVLHLGQGGDYGRFSDATLHPNDTEPLQVLQSVSLLIARNAFFS